MSWGDRCSQSRSFLFRNPTLPAGGWGGAAPRCPCWPFQRTGAASVFLTIPRVRLPPSRVLPRPRPPVTPRPTARTPVPADKCPSPQSLRSSRRLRRAPHDSSTAFCCSLKNLGDVRLSTAFAALICFTFPFSEYVKLLYGSKVETVKRNSQDSAGPSAPLPLILPKGKHFLLVFVLSFLFLFLKRNTRSYIFMDLTPEIEHCT